MGGVGRHRGLVGARAVARSSAGSVAAGGPGSRDAERAGPGGGSSCRSLAVLVTTVVFYGAHRIRAPAEPVVVVLAATGVVALYQRWTTRRDAPAVRPSSPDDEHDGRALAGGHHG